MSSAGFKPWMDARPRQNVSSSSSSTVCAESSAPADVSTCQEPRVRTRAASMATVHRHGYFFFPTMRLLNRRMLCRKRESHALLANANLLYFPLWIWYLSIFLFDVYGVDGITRIFYFVSMLLFWMDVFFGFLQVIMETVSWRRMKNTQPTKEGVAKRKLLKSTKWILPSLANAGLSPVLNLRFVFEWI